MNFKDFVESYVKLLEEHPEFGDLEVWSYSDDEGNTVLPIHDSTSFAYVGKGQTSETDEYVQDSEIEECLDWEEITLDEFLAGHKQIILVG